MATLPGLVKDASPPATDTQLSPILIPDGTTLLTTKQHNKIVDYLSGDAGPDFIPQNAIANLVSDLAGKEDSLGFTPEDVDNKVTEILAPGSDTSYPTEKAVRDQLNLKENNLGFTPENVSNKTAIFQVTPDDVSYPTEKLVKDSLDGKEDSLGFTPENIINKTAVFQVTPDDVSYPTEKLVKDSLDGKEDSLGFIPEDVSNKVTEILAPGSDTDYPSEKAVRDALALKENSLGFTPENIANKVTSIGTPIDNTTYPSEAAVRAGLDSISPIGLHDIWIDAGGIIPVDSGATAIRLIGAGDNQKSISYVPFVDLINTYAVVKFKLPRNYNNGTLTAVINWTSDIEGAGNVVWGIAGVAVSDGVDIAGVGADYGAEITVTDTQTSINFSQDTPRTTPITLAGSPADLDTIYLRVRRLGADVADTFDQTAHLIGISIELTLDEAVSS